ncbi:hypothetical protein [Pseudanabaena sp. FACHB-2040]|uniref:hypothetical protein n=1 Tax=Pseudanabaena sp. FACHB-2040 TaxID=2692859 RepID=UPI00168A12F2|nr:hypothetical protein [Pseudanabaena sp. FACHB-2040]MBD2257761.1 hypothetical protein [Pseudanabaena sp. FACHB-2040]
MAAESSFSPAERLESLKAAVLTGFNAGVVAALLLVAHRTQSLGWAAAFASTTAAGLSGWGFWVGVAISAFSGSLFGLTYRYAVRRDSNPQLKLGVVLAFVLVRGLAQVDIGSALAQRGWPFLAALTESLLLFATAGILLDLALQNHWIKPFGSD